ncbi:MAG: hypothetical protein KGL39_24415 [Patescibacteria group bacterium]|nr:hypothetical protein [Patescibacteria group bacterium]
MTELVKQKVTGWDDWPADVVDRLHEWNDARLLSFPQGPDYRCEGGCARMIKAHSSGNPRVRSHNKAPGASVCEDCLIAFARKFNTPPRLGHYGVVYELQRKAAKYQQQIAALEGHVARLYKQCYLDDVYTAELEAAIDPDKLRTIKNELRGKDRAPHRRRTREVFQLWDLSIGRKLDQTRDPAVADNWWVQNKGNPERQIIPEPPSAIAHWHSVYPTD